MKRCNIHVVLSKKQLQEEMGRFRFQKTDLSCIMEVNKALQPLLKIEAFYEEAARFNTIIKQEEASDCMAEEQSGNKDITKYIAFVTLGAAIDCLQEEYSQKEMVFEAYIVECLGMIYLSHAYDKLFAAMAVQEKGVFFKFSFWEEHYALEQLYDVLAEAKQTGIKAGKEGIMSPSKSVVMFVRLNLGKPYKQRKESNWKSGRSSGRTMCMNCTNKCERGIISSDCENSCKQ